MVVTVKESKTIQIGTMVFSIVGCYILIGLTCSFIVVDTYGTTISSPIRGKDLEARTFFDVVVTVSALTGICITKSYTMGMSTGRTSTVVAVMD